MPLTPQQLRTLDAASNRYLGRPLRSCTVSELWRLVDTLTERADALEAELDIMEAKAAAADNFVLDGVGALENHANGAAR